MPVQEMNVPGSGARPFAAKWADAVALKTALAGCFVKLFKATELVIDDTITLAALDAIEADYSGYTGGGIEVAAAGDPYSDADNKVYVTLPSVQFNDVPGTPNVENEIRGAYVEDAAGVLRGVVVFDTTIVMATAASSIVTIITFEVQ
jgi:hypothetical protein